MWRRPACAVAGLRGGAAGRRRRAAGRCDRWLPRPAASPACETGPPGVGAVGGLRRAVVAAGGCGLRGCLARPEPRGGWAVAAAVIGAAPAGRLAGAVRRGGRSRRSGGSRVAAVVVRGRDPALDVGLVDSVGRRRRGRAAGGQPSGAPAGVVRRTAALRPSARSAAWPPSAGSSRRLVCALGPAALGPRRRLAGRLSGRVGLRPGAAGVARRPGARSVSGAVGRPRRLGRGAVCLGLALAAGPLRSWARTVLRTAGSIGRVGGRFCRPRSGDAGGRRRGRSVRPVAVRWSLRGPVQQVGPRRRVRGPGRLRRSSGLPGSSGGGTVQLGGERRSERLPPSPARAPVAAARCRSPGLRSGPVTELVMRRFPSSVSALSRARRAPSGPSARTPGSRRTAGCRRTCARCRRRRCTRPAPAAPT